jgi:hypothetical protein
MMFVIPNVIDSSMLCRHHDDIHVCYEDTKRTCSVPLYPQERMLRTCWELHYWICYL